jgi:tellurite resistance protein
MSEGFGELGQLQEDAWFHKQEQEALAQQRQRVAREAAAAEMMATLGLTDPAAAADLVAAGFTPETARLLFVVPAVQVAWSDGDASAKEKAAVLDIAAHLGAPAGSKARAKVEQWLAESPSAELYGIALEGIKAVLASRSTEDAAQLRKDVLDHCKRVAEASGGFLGMARVSDEEEHILHRLAAELG